MKHLIFFLAALLIFSTGFSQTVENIRVTQEGEQLKITYRIGASTETQLFNVFLSCTMAGGVKVEPRAVIGDIGENVIGGKSYYTVMWDVFEDVDEVVDPDITVKVELVEDLEAPITRDVQAEEAIEPEAQEPEPQTQLENPALADDEDIKENPFRKNGFVAYNGILGFGIPIGISFGSLNNWGYYVTPMRLGIDSYDISYYDGYQTVYDTEIDVHYMFSAGVTKHFVSAGSYRLHGYFGLGTHVYGAYLKGLVYDPYYDSHFQMETGVVNVIGGLNLTLGISYSIGYAYALNFVFGIGFVF